MLVSHKGGAVVDIWVLNGPNMHALGSREVEIYGQRSLADLESLLKERSAQLGCHVECRQTNHEGVMLDWLFEAKQRGCSAMVLNFAAWTHTSLALADAVCAVNIPFVEVHISNVFQRDMIRHRSQTAPFALGFLCGFGLDGYVMALDYVHHYVGHKA